jgi:hypothetical protein
VHTFVFCVEINIDIIIEGKFSGPSALNNRSGEIKGLERMSIRAYAVDTRLLWLFEGHFLALSAGRRSRLACFGSKDAARRDILKG